MAKKAKSQTSKTRGKKKKFPKAKKPVERPCGETLWIWIVPRKGKAKWHRIMPRRFKCKPGCRVVYPRRDGNRPFETLITWCYPRRKSAAGTTKGAKAVDCYQSYCEVDENGDGYDGCEGICYCPIEYQGYAEQSPCFERESSKSKKAGAKKK